MNTHHTANGAGRYDSTRDAWERIWEQESDFQVELDAVAYPRSLKTINTYLPYLPQDERILEAGSGLGAVVVTLRERGYNVLGLDYAVNALRATRRHDDSLQLAAGDVHTMPFPDASFGAYLSFGVLEHFEHGMGPALQEAARVLKPNGVLVMTIPYPNVVWLAVQAKRRLTGQGALTDDDFYESTYTRHQLHDACRDAGFRVLVDRPTSHDFTLWGLGGPFRGRGYYETSSLAESLGGVLAARLPWWFNYMTLIVARKVAT